MLLFFGRRSVYLCACLFAFYSIYHLLSTITFISVHRLNHFGVLVLEVRRKNRRTNCIHLDMSSLECISIFQSINWNEVIRGIRKNERM